jgi:hypothetical protein
VSARSVSSVHADGLEQQAAPTRASEPPPTSFQQDYGSPLRKKNPNAELRSQFG